LNTIVIQCTGKNKRPFSPKLNVPGNGLVVNHKPFPISNKSKGLAYFQHDMSLKLICWAGHYARHGDQHGRSKATDLGADQGIFERNIGGGISSSKK
jgi:hypothetical protein